jgi:type IV secretory pathway VirB10-like protein
MGGLIGQLDLNNCGSLNSMGFIKKIFGGIFSLIGGIFGAIAKVFGLGNKSEFYMEIDESETPTEAPAPPAQASSQATPEPKPTASAQVAAVAPPAPVPTPQPVSAPATPAEPEMTFATDYLINPKFSNTQRRRPGPSLSPFKDMARSVGRPSMARP